MDQERKFTQTETGHPQINRVEVSRSALLHNLALFRRLAPRSNLLAVVKSNAYGHGLETVSKVLAGKVDWFGVNCFDEACAVRKIDPQTPILVMGLNGREIETVVRSSALGENSSNIHSGIHPNIHFVAAGEENLHLIGSAIERSSGQKKLLIHLKVDSGLSRLGVQGRALRENLQLLAQDRHFNWQGLMTHFANVEDVTDQDFALEQLRRFQQACDLSSRLIGQKSLLRHAAASAASLLLPSAHLDMIRVGISIYGLWPSPQTRLSVLAPRSGAIWRSESENSKDESSEGENSKNEGSVDKSNIDESNAGAGGGIRLRPVLRWITQVVHLQDLPPGSFVGYGCSRRVETKTKIAVLPVGYYEGYSRALSDRSYVLIRGQRAPLLGRVSMNMITVDVSPIAGVSLGDEAVLIGRMGREEISADYLAELIGSINYEIVTGINAQIPRILTE